VLAYSEKGTGMPLILLHAFPLNRCMWEAQLESWSRHFRVIAPDFRGFGETPVGEEDSRMESFADDVRHLLEALTVQGKAVVIGLSMGGYVAFEFARKYGDRLRGLILVATQPTHDSSQSRSARYELADLIRKQGMEVLVERMTPKLLGKTSLESRPEVVKRVCQLILANPAKGVAKACYALASRRDSTPVLDRITVPTLIVAGEEDPIVPKGQLEAMDEGIRQSQLVVLEKCGHLVNLEQAEKFNSLVQEFVEGLL
jgi:3-oxoadipate enol-lactonase